MVSDFAVPVRSLKCYNGIDGERLEIRSLYVTDLHNLLMSKKKYCTMFLFFHIDNDKK
jgi:hypothetical protein